MANYRRGRINDEMQKVVAEILRELKDPRVSDAFLSVTGAEVTPDLKYAKIYYSALRGEPKEIKKGLVSSAGFIRKKVAERMNLRITPEFTFVADDSIRHGAHISELLNSLTYSEETPEKDGKGDGV
ncbi:MAG: 30S ribosome-binding factor RbfA [Clostridia bacterium]|nr:30S ribosome-binding factor RbfA [Clostridia bacterium]